MSNPEKQRRHSGVTLIELLLAVMLLGLAVGLAMPALIGLRDRLAVSAASRAMRDALVLAREHAAASGTRAAVQFGTGQARVVVHAADDSLLRLPLGARYGVALEASRESTAYLPSGLGAGAANVRLVLGRGTARDTITVSRLGRVR